MDRQGHQTFDMYLHHSPELDQLEGWHSYSKSKGYAVLASSFGTIYAG
jgi:hypothetical protein